MPESRTACRNSKNYHCTVEEYDIREFVLVWVCEIPSDIQASGRLQLDCRTQRWIVLIHRQRCWVLLENRTQRWGRRERKKERERGGEREKRERRKREREEEREREGESERK